MWYDETATIGGWHQLHFASGIDREAVFAQARHKKRWPNGEPSPAMTPPVAMAESKPVNHQKEEAKPQAPRSGRKARR
jgi:hypothetical protein